MINNLISPYELAEASETDAKLLNDMLDSFNGRQLEFQGDVEFFKDYIVRNDSKIIAGIRSCFYFNECVVINLLFVAEDYRHQGLGSYLLDKIEAEARAIGIKLIHLDTFDFQAKDFYKKHGYEVFGTLENCVYGHDRFYMKKQLA